MNPEMNSHPDQQEIDWFEAAGELEQRGKSITDRSMLVRLRALAPIAHGAFGASAGNATLIRRVAVVCVKGMPRVPVISGNALRGVLRRIAMRKLFDAAGLSKRTVEPVVWDRLYAALANGGHLEGSETSVKPDRIDALRAALPPLSIFGAALYSWMLPGRMSVGFLWPRCQETVVAGLVEPSIPDENLLCAEELVEELSHCRHVDRTEQDPTVSGVTPMPTTMETLSAGSVLESVIRYNSSATTLEVGCVQQAIAVLDAVGGKSGAGLGRVEVVASSDHVQEYETWLTGRQARRDSLMELAGVLAPSKTKKPSKRAARAAAKDVVADSPTEVAPSDEGPTGEGS